MAQVVDEGSVMGVVFEGAEELGHLNELLEWALTTSVAVGVPAYVLAVWHREVENALTAVPKVDEAEEEEEIREIVGATNITAPAKRAILRSGVREG